MNIVIPEVILFHRDHNKQCTCRYHMTACQHLQINFYMCSPHEDCEVLFTCHEEA